MRIPGLLAVLVAAAAACTGNTPISSDLVPPALGLVPGAASLDDATARFPRAEIGKGSYNDAPATSLRDRDARVSMWFTGSPPVLVNAEIHADGMCAFVKEKIAPQKGSTSCPGNRRTGDHGAMTYCLAGPRGSGTVWVDCRPESGVDDLTYHLAK